jgi:hypothetical protein
MTPALLNQFAPPLRIPSRIAQLDVQTQPPDCAPGFDAEGTLRKLIQF